MEYVNSITIPRLQNVIKGDQEGISKKVGWQGGGSFVYCELANANQTFVNQIQKAKNCEKLIEIWKAMQKKAFLSYRIDLQKIDLACADFMALNLDDQKHFLIEVMDKNMLYVPASEMEDITYGISDEDKILNSQFFNKM